MRQEKVKSSLPHGTVPQKRVGESEEKFRLLFEKSCDPILLLDGNAYIDCNEATLKCMRCSRREQIIGLHPWDLSPGRQPDGRLSSEKAREILRATAIKGTNRFEWVHRTFDGKELWMDVSLTLIGVDGRQVMYTIWRDITRRKRAESALLQSRLQLSDAMDLARIVHWELDPRTDTFIFNDHFYTLYATTAKREGGYRMSREEYGKRFVHPDDLPLFAQAAEKRRLEKSREFFNEFEHRIVRRDGEVRYILARIRASKNAVGRVIRCYGANQDVTERKLTAQALLESEERYRTAIENSNDGVAIVRGDEHIYVNQRFLAMFGYDDAAEVLGTRVYVTVHAEDREKVVAMNRSRQRGEPVPSRYEFHGVRKDGSSIRVEVSASRIVYQGETATLAYLRDITELHHAQEQLRHAQKMEALGTLSAGVAHDFRNILTAIEGFAHLGSRKLQDESKANRYLQQICRAVERGKDVVRQILTFSQKGEDKPRPTDLIPVVKESIGMLRASLHPNIDIRENVRVESSIVLADSTQVQQIIVNLAMNAAYAMRQKRGILTIGASHLDVAPSDGLASEMATGPYLKLTISDTGTGMDAQTVERLFNPFFTTKKRTEGTGLGLWVVHGIVKRHKGSITVRSAPGHGSTFEVFLPRVIL